MKRVNDYQIIKKIEEAYGIHMSVERAIDILTIARVQYSSFGALPEAIDTLIDAYREQKKEIAVLKAYKLDCDAVMGKEMVVAILDFEMPEKCVWDCPLCNRDGGACELSDVITSDVERPLDCPLVKVKIGK